MGAHDALCIANAAELYRQKGRETFFMIFDFFKNKIFHEVTIGIAGNKKNRSVSLLYIVATIQHLQLNSNKINSLVLTNFTGIPHIIYTTVTGISHWHLYPVLNK